MRIKSEFEDYYDWCAYMCAEDNYWERHLNEYKTDELIPKKLLIDINRIVSEYMRGKRFPLFFENSTDSNTISFSCDFVILGEQFIPFFTIHNKDGYRFIYNVNEASDVFEEFDRILFINHYSAIISDWFNNPNHNIYNAVRKLTDVPVIIYSYYCDGDDVHRSKAMKQRTNLNGILKKVEFHKHFDSHHTIQEIEMYLNKLKTNEDEVIFSNKQKIESHGFDNKQSFRHRK